MPDVPVKLENIELEWSDEPVGIPITGTEPEAYAVLPLRVPGRRFDRYTSAIRYLDPPSLFENRASYRLLEADLSPRSPRMIFGLGTYFDKLDALEAAAHELAAILHSRGRTDQTQSCQNYHCAVSSATRSICAVARSCQQSKH